MNTFGRSMVGGLTALVLSAFSWSAQAATANLVYNGSYVDMYLKSFPGGLNEQQIFLDGVTGATTVTGHVGSQTGTPLVTFSSATDTLDAKQGYASISAGDGALNDLTITAPGYLFDDFIFGISLTKDNADLTVTATDQSGGTSAYSGWTSDKAWVSGNNDVLVLSHSGTLMQSINIQSSVGFTLAGIEQVKQMNISGLTPVPEPNTYLLMAAGLGLMGFVARRRMNA